MNKKTLFEYKCAKQILRDLNKTLLNARSICTQCWERRCKSYRNRFWSFYLLFVFRSRERSWSIHYTILSFDHMAHLNDFGPRISEVFAQTNGLTQAHVVSRTPPPCDSSNRNAIAVKTTRHRSLLTLISNEYLGKTVQDFSSTVSKPNWRALPRRNIMWYHRNKTSPAPKLLGTRSAIDAQMLKSKAIQVLDVTPSGKLITVQVA